MARSSLAARMRNGDPMLGLVVKMPNQALIESAGYAGFDLIVIDTEHGLGDGIELEHHLRAADSARVPALVRLGGQAPIEALRALDAGAAGIIVPHVNGPEDALRAVQSAHYPPLGERGFAMSTRAGRHASVTVADHLEHAAVETVVIVQVEHALAVENIVDILATDHLDGIWVGPSDLSISLGQPGAYDHPVFQQAMDTILAASALHGDKTLAVVATDATAVHKWLERGATMFLAPSPALTTPALRAFVTGVNAFGPTDKEITHA